MSDAPAPPRPRYGRALFRLGLSAAVLAVVVKLVGPRTVYDAIRSVPFTGWLAGLVGFCGFHFVGAVKWRLFMGLAGADVKLGVTVRAYAAGLFANLCLPSLVGGDVLRAGIVLGTTTRKEAVVFGSLVDRFADVAALGTLVLIGALAAPSAVNDLEGIAGPITWIATALPVIAVASAVVGLLVLRRLRLRSLPKKVAKILIGFLRALRAMRARPTLGLRGYALCLVVQAGFVAVNALLGDAMGLDLDFRLWLLLWPLAKIAAMLPLSLGGIGVREAAFATLVAPFAAEELAVAQSLVWESILVTGGLLAGAWWALGRKTS